MTRNEFLRTTVMFTLIGILAALAFQSCGCADLFKAPV